MWNVKWLLVLALCLVYKWNMIKTKQTSLLWCVCSTCRNDDKLAASAASASQQSLCRVNLLQHTHTQPINHWRCTAWSHNYTLCQVSNVITANSSTLSSWACKMVWRHPLCSLWLLLPLTLQWTNHWRCTADRAVNQWCASMNMHDGANNSVEKPWTINSRETDCLNTGCGYG